MKDLVFEPGVHTLSQPIVGSVRISNSGEGEVVLRLEGGGTLINLNDPSAEVLLQGVALEGGAPVLSIHAGRVEMTDCTIRRPSEPAERDPANWCEDASAWADPNGLICLLGDDAELVARGCSIQGPRVEAYGDEKHYPEVVRAGGSEFYSDWTAKWGTLCGVYVAAGQLEATDCSITEQIMDGILVCSGSVSVRKSSLSDNGFCGLRCLGFYPNQLVCLDECTLQGNHRHGILAENGASPRIRDCTIRENLDDGMYLVRGANPEVVGCRFERNLGRGVHAEGFYKDDECEEVTRGSFENCHFSFNTYLGIEIELSSCNPTFNDCHVQGNGRTGIHTSGGGRFIGCTVLENASCGVEIGDGSPVFLDCRISRNAGHGAHLEDGSNPSFIACRFDGNAEGGISITDDEGDGWSGVTALGYFRDCDVSNNGKVGIKIMSGANPTLHACKVALNQGPGILVDGKTEEAKAQELDWIETMGTIEQCMIHDNAEHGVMVTQGGSPCLRDCRTHGNHGYGIFVAGPGEGSNKRSRTTIVACEQDRNGLGGILIEEGNDVSVRFCTPEGNA